MEMNVMTGVYTNNGELYNFSFNTNISVANKLKFVDTVVSILVDENHYNSVIRDLIFDFYIIDILTDVDVEELKRSPNFLNDVEQFLSETNIVEIVKANDYYNLLNELNDAIDKSIQYLTGIHPSLIADSISSLIRTIENKINEIDLDNMMSMAQKFANMTEDFTIENAMNLYMNSDVHKKNLAEIANFKSNKK